MSPSSCGLLLNLDHDPVNSISHQLVLAGPGFITTHNPYQKKDGFCNIDSSTDNIFNCFYETSLKNQVY